MKDYMLTYGKYYYLEMIGYLDLDFVGCVNKKNPYYDIYSVKLKEQSYKRVQNILLLLHSL